MGDNERTCMIYKFITHHLGSCLLYLQFRNVKYLRYYYKDAKDTSWKWDERLVKSYFEHSFMVVAEVMTV